MNEEDNVQTVKDAYLAFQDGNIPALLDCLKEDVQWSSIGPPELIPMAGTRKGRNQVKEFFDTLKSFEEVQSFRPQHFIAQGNRVVAMGECQARVRSTGISVTSPWVHVFTFRDGKISEFRSFDDTAATVKALGDVQTRTARAGTSGLRRAVL